MGHAAAVSATGQGRGADRRFREIAARPMLSRASCLAGLFSRSCSEVAHNRLQNVLPEAVFDAFVEEVCKPYYAPRMGAPLQPPRWYFRLRVHLAIGQVVARADETAPHVDDRLLLVNGNTGQVICDDGRDDLFCVTRVHAWRDYHGYRHHYRTMRCR